MKKILLVLTILTNALTFAQRGGLKGRVLDETKQPLPGATIVITETKAGAATDFDGNYELLNIKNGTYKVSVTFIGYQPIEETIKINNGITVKNFNLVPATNKLDEIIVQGSIARGQAKALNKQKSNDNITNVISSDQVGKFPDANIGDALKRVPGIAMQNDQGEARDIIVRGIAPQLNSVTLNGDKLPSAEGDNRRVQMDLIPSDMIQTIEVSKAVTPDMEGDAIGGSVNLVTRNATSKFRANITGSYGQSPIRDGNNYNIYALVSGRTKDGKLGAVLNGGYNSNDYGSDNVEFEWKKADLIKDYQIRKYDVKRVRQSVGLNLDWKPDPNHTLEFKSLYNLRNDLENRYRLRFKYDNKKDLYEVRRETKGGINNNKNKNRRLEQQSTYKFGIGGKHILGKVKLDWKVSTSKAKEVRPNERYISYRYKKIPGTSIKVDLSNKERPFFGAPDGVKEENFIANDYNKFSLKEISEEDKYTQERKVSSRINVKIPLTTEGDYQNSLKFGYKYKYKEKLRDNIFYEYDNVVEDTYGDKMTAKGVTLSNQTDTGFLPGSKYKAGQFISNTFLGSLTLRNGKKVKGEYVPVNYNADENIYAFYGMLKQDLGEKLSLVAGLRTEKTDVDYTGYQYIAEFEDEDTGDTILEEQITTKNGSKSYTNWMPNLQLKFKPNNNIVVRAAWTNTIARPNYFDLVPYENVIAEDGEVELGNPELNAMTSMNVDVMGEYYFSNVGIISVGGFYKNIDSFIYKQVADENRTYQSKTDEYEVKRIYNGGTADVYGFEFGIQRKLNFLPGFLRNLTFYGNYTYTGSEVSGIKNREDGLALAGAIKHMANTSLAYETKKFTLRGSLNYAGDYIDEYGDEAFEDSYYDEQLFVDVNASYEIAKGLRLFGEAKNLTNQPLRFYQGTKEQTMQVEFYDINWNVGLKYNF